MNYSIRLLEWKISAERIQVVLCSLEVHLQFQLSCRERSISLFQIERSLFLRFIPESERFLL